MTPTNAAAVSGIGSRAASDPSAVGSAVLVFVVSLLVGTVAIRLGARLSVDRDYGFGRAFVTALVGALVSSLVCYAVGWIPLVGPLLALVAWVALLDWQYPGGWGTAVGIGAASWVVAVLVLHGLRVVGFVTGQAVGLPGS